MNDRITIQGLRLLALVGVHPIEREVPQPLLIDLHVETDVRRAAQTDALSDTVDYGELAQNVRALVAAQHHNLIETVADRIARHVLFAYPTQVRSVVVLVRKFRAVADTQHVAVKIERLRGDYPPQ